MDMISQLPEGILYHILSFLSTKNAVQTCVLSKLWRHLVSTRPNIQFSLSCFNGNKETFMSVLDKTLQRYHDEKICIQVFHVMMWCDDYELISLLEKLIPIVALNMGVNKFSLYIRGTISAYFDLPSVVFEAQSLKHLNLRGFKLNSIEKIHFKYLRRLSLSEVYISDAAFEKIISSCHLIEDVVLFCCEGLKTIQVMHKHHKYFKGFELWGRHSKGDDVNGISIEIGVPTLETLKIVGCPNWYHQHKYFPCLMSLNLDNMRLSNWSFDFFSCNYLPNLKILTLNYCYGFEEFHLSSVSIKHLNIEGMKKSIKAVIDVPSMVKFDYHGDIPSSIAFTATTFGYQWKSNICLCFYDVHHSSWFLKLNKLLDVVSQSEISLHLFDNGLSDNRQNIEDVLDTTCDGLYKPTVAVEQLKLALSGPSSSYSFSPVINNMFRICRPRNIIQCWCTHKSDRAGKKLAEFL
ncbi:hypothetical protein DH2020_044742 [Rehmannia glutinosa]|uniref:F-box domain-containing protein n=1 Tax=Rehmannia glutinosa TaxID=99300 RepID=A0ABR0UGS1_REHGL